MESVMSGASDITGKAVKDFLAEAEEILDQLCADLGELCDGTDGGECNPDSLNSVFRGAHSLKGLAGMFGFTGIQDLSHNMENLLDSLRLGKIGLGPQVMAVLMESLETLGTMIRNLGEGILVEPSMQPLLKRISDCVANNGALDNDSVLASLDIPASMINALTEYEEHRLLENIKKSRNIYSVLASFSLATFDQDLAELTDALKKNGEVISTLPSVGANIESSIDFEILFGSAKNLEEIASLVSDSNATVRRVSSGGGAPPVQPAQPATPAVVAEPAPSPAEPEETKPVPGGPGDAGITAKSMSRTVRVDIGKLDDLMNIVGELVLSHSTITDIAEKMRKAGYSTMLAELLKAAKGLERKLNELQKGVMEIRMIPVGQLYEKMGRIVRKISKEQGKKVDLRVFGADTELDKLIMEDIADPLMHIIRNAIDHGIEAPEERRGAGKVERGTIRLSSYQKGNHVVIEVEDDGRGIDVSKVKRKAIEKGLISPSDSLTDREAVELIFLPGFSTSETVSEISGRGVGMDVVKNNIAAVSGMVDVESVQGQGSRMTITLPITLAIIKALIIATAGRYYALPITSVLESIMIDPADILTVERKEVIQLRESTLPLLRLNRFFHLDGEPTTDNVFVVVVGVADKRLGIVVDELLGQQDIVIKTLGPVFEGVKGVSGAADLGDQRTILVLDVGGIINEATKGGSQT
jgi:two-component system chemotaxis sensor kinase CheA